MCNWTRDCFVFSSCNSKGTHYYKVKLNQGKGSRCSKGPHERLVETQGDCPECLESRSSVPSGALNAFMDSKSGASRISSFKSFLSRTDQTPSQDLAPSTPREGISIADRLRPPSLPPHRSTSRKLAHLPSGTLFPRTTSRSVSRGAEVSTRKSYGTFRSGHLYPPLGGDVSTEENELHDREADLEIATADYAFKRYSRRKDQSKAPATSDTGSVQPQLYVGAPLSSPVMIYGTIVDVTAVIFLQIVDNHDHLPLLLLAGCWFETLTKNAVPWIIEDRLRTLFRDVTVEAVSPKRRLVLQWLLDQSGSLSQQFYARHSHLLPNLVEPMTGLQVSRETFHSSREWEDAIPLGAAFYVPVFDGLPLQLSEVKSILHYIVEESKSVEALKCSLYKKIFETMEASWINELGTELPSAIKNDNVWTIMEMDTQGMKDKVQLAFEAYSGGPWDWWPLDNPRTELQSQKRRVAWLSEAGHYHWIDVSSSLAERLRIFMRCSGVVSYPEVSQKPGSLLQDGSPLANVSTGSSTSSTTSSRGAASILPGTSTTSSPGTSQSGDSIGTTLIGDMVRDPFVLLCGWQGMNIVAAEIKTPSDMDDHNFLLNVRCKYNEVIRNSWRYYVEPLKFYYCDIGRFQKTDNSSFTFLHHELPCSQKSSYHPLKPECSEHYNYKLRPKRLQVSKHQWASAFHTKNLKPGRRDILPFVPQREGSFQLDLPHPNESEDVWGLDIKLQPSLLGIVARIVILSILPTVYMAYSLLRNPSDLQNATVPLFTIFAVVATIMMPLYKGFDPSWCGSACTSCNKP